MTGYQDLLRAIELKGWTHISAITRLEIVRGMQERERRETFNLLDSLETIPMNTEVADLAGEFIRSWRGRGINLSDADAIIAASASSRGLTLVTTNTKHFPMPDLVIFQADEKGNITLRE
jgi:hypothetical protein